MESAQIDNEWKYRIIVLPMNGKKGGQRERTGNINYFMKEVINNVYNVGYPFVHNSILSLM